MKKFCALVVLTLSLAVFAYADDGHMGTMKAPPPPPTPTATAPGDILQPIVEAIAVALLSLS
jgi:hypothetical protein